MFIKLLPDILRYITTSTCLITLFFALSRPKYKIKIYIIIAVLVVLFDATICTLLSVYNKLSLDLFYSITFYLLLACFHKPLFKDNILQWLFNCLTVYIVHVIIFFASFYLGELMPFNGYGVLIFKLVLFGLFISFFYFYLKPLYLEVSESWEIFILPIIGILISYLYLVISEGSAYTSMTHNFVYYCFLTGVTILIYSSIIRTFFLTKKKQLLREENQKRKLNEDLLLNELNSYHQFVNIAKESRHDLRHHIAVLSAYLAEQNIQDAKNYLSEYTNSIDSSALTEFCKNPLANSVLKVYENRIRSLGIDFIFETEALGQFPFSLIETSTVLSNILENALEATEKCKAEKKFIKLNSNIKDNKLILEVQNSSDLNKNFKDTFPSSSKKNGGVGLASIKSVIDKYNGVLFLTQSSGVFTLRLVVSIK